MLPEAVASGAETRNLGFGTPHGHGEVQADQDRGDRREAGMRLVAMQTGPVTLRTPRARCAEAWER
jgi:hypothetical protein